MVANIKSITQISYPDTEFSENFSFDSVLPQGVFSFRFRYMNSRWNCWVTLPNGEIRQIGVLPYVISCAGFLDFGFMFGTSLKEITKDELKNTFLYVLEWE